MREVRNLYQVEQLPIFQNRMYDIEAEAKACPKGDVRLVEDLQSGLVYNVAFLPELVQYDEHYQNEQGVSPFFRAHLEQVSDVVERTIGKQSIIEVGCGKGCFLEMMAARGFEISGVDPTYEGDNPAVIKQYFTPELGIRVDGIVLRHVLEHIQDPIDFLERTKEANGGNGKIYIEVPCFDWICQHRAWFDIFYEHVNYFRLDDFYRIFGTVYESGRFFGEQYLYVVAELSSLKRPEYDDNRRVSFPSDFLRSLAQSPEHSAVWGGASKGVIFALLKARMGTPVTTIIDINPAKQGKYIPGTGLRVQSPEEALHCLPKGATIFVMNSNYLHEIKQMSGNVFHYIGIDHV